MNVVTLLHQPICILNYVSLLFSIIYLYNIDDEDLRVLQTDITYINVK